MIIRIGIIDATEYFYYDCITEKTIKDYPNVLFFYYDREKLNFKYKRSKSSSFDMGLLVNWKNLYITMYKRIIFLNGVTHINNRNWSFKIFVN